MPDIGSVSNVWPDSAYFDELFSRRHIETYKYQKCYVLVSTLVKIWEFAH